MIMIRDLSNGIYGTLNWGIGYNNLCAIQKVLKDEYYYNESDPTTITKVKQIGTEALHIGAKWATGLTLADKAIRDVSTWMFGPPGYTTSIPEWMPVRLEYIPAPSTLRQWGPTVLGGLSFIYNAHVCLDSVIKGYKNIKGVIEVDYDYQAKLSFTKLRKGITNVSTVFPLVYVCYHFGLAGSTLAVPALWASNHKSAKHWIGKSVKVGIVAFTAFNIIGSPALNITRNYVAPALTPILDKFA